MHAPASLLVPHYQCALPLLTVLFGAAVGGIVCGGPRTWRHEPGVTRFFWKKNNNNKSSLGLSSLHSCRLSWIYISAHVFLLPLSVIWSCWLNWACLCRCLCFMWDLIRISGLIKPDRFRDWEANRSGCSPTFFFFPSPVRAGMSFTRVDYIAPWWTYWLHNFPHINLRLQPTDKSFQPEDENYQQVSRAKMGHRRAILQFRWWVHNKSGA